MKSYEEMTQSVLEKVKERQIVRKRRNRRVAVVACGLCCILLSVNISQQLKDPANPAIKEETALATDVTDAPSGTDKSNVPRIMLLAAMPAGESKMQRPFNLDVPYKAEIRVHNISGLTESELQQIILEEQSYVRKIAGENALDYSYSPNKRNNVFITSISLGFFGVRFEDIAKVDRIRAAVTDNGRLHIVPRVDGCSNSAYGELSIIDIDGESLRKIALDDQNSGIEMYWHISAETADRINAVPDMDLSSISDTITVTVNYTDGREEIATVYIYVDTEGQVGAIMDEPIIMQ